MADSKISALTDLTQPAADDYVPIVDISEASDANKNKRITYGLLVPNGINVKAYGATGDGTTDDTAAFQAASAALAVGGKLFIPEGTYRITDTVNFNTVGCEIEGASKTGSIIRFDPTTSKTCFKSTLTQDPIVFRSLYFTRPATRANPAAAMTAIEIIDGSGADCVDIRIGNGAASGGWSDTGGNSIGIKYNGRECCSIRRPRIFADNPLVFGTNPNHPNLDVDQIHVQDSYLVNTTSTGAKILIEDETNVFHFTVDGYNAWALGKYGVYWVTTSQDTISYSVKLSGIRHEQGEDSTGWLTYIDHASFKVQNLMLDNIHGDIQMDNGHYIKGAANIRLSNLNCTGDGVALQVEDGASDRQTEYLSWTNCRLGNNAASSVSITDSLTRKWETQPPTENLFGAGTDAVYTRARSGFTYAWKEKGMYVGRNALQYSEAFELVKPISFTNTSTTTNRLTGGDFTGVRRGDCIYISGTAGADEYVNVAADGDATGVDIVAGSINTTESGSFTAIHCFEMPFSRNVISHVARVKVTCYIIDAISSQESVSAEYSIGKTGSANIISESDASILSVGELSTTAAPTSNIVEINSVGSPARMWNNRSGATNNVQVIVEGTYW